MIYEKIDLIVDTELYGRLHEEYLIDVNNTQDNKANKVINNK